MYNRNNSDNSKKCFLCSTPWWQYLSKICLVSYASNWFGLFVEFISQHWLLPRPVDIKYIIKLQEHFFLSRIPKYIFPNRIFFPTFPFHFVQFFVCFLYSFFKSLVAAIVFCFIIFRRCFLFRLYLKWFWWFCSDCLSGMP